MPDIIQLLTADHAEVLALLEKLAATRNTAPRTREKLREQITAKLKAHTQAEEDVFYPALREAGHEDQDEQMLIEAVEEHALADEVLARLGADDAPDNTFAAHAKLLKDLVEHHAQEEEKEMFPRARTLLSKNQRAELGQRVEVRKQSMLASA